MDFHSVMETFAEAWVAANTHTPLTKAAEQALINGPTAGLTPVQNVSHDGTNDKHDIDCLRQDIETPSESFQGRQSPTDSQSGCTTLYELRPPLKNLSNPHEISKGKLIAVHCIVEQNPGPQACGQYVELDSYAIIPGDTLFNELVRTALIKLGYDDKQILGAKGSIQVKNWKPLALDQVSEDPEATITEILGDVVTVVALHIRLYSTPDNILQWTDATVRNAILELLREISQSKLAKLCPLSQPMLSSIINNRYMGRIGKEKCQEFGKWYMNYRKQNPDKAIPEIVPCERPLDGRLTFHPTKELPLMREWFHTCRNPTRRIFQMYADTLNEGSVRQQERPKVTLPALKNWWKNEKQRERKQKSDRHAPEEAKTKRKRKDGFKLYPPKDDSSCDARLQDTDSLENRSVTVLSSKSFLDESCDVDHDCNGGIKKDCLILDNSNNDQKTCIPDNLDDGHSDQDDIFSKVHSKCNDQNHIVFSTVQEQFYSQNANDIELPSNGSGGIGVH